MKIKTLELTNFRCFESLKINLHEQLTVLVANNGYGKTAVLDALAIGLGIFLSHLPNIPGRNPKGTDFLVPDDGKKPPYMRIRLETTDGMVWDRTEKRDQLKDTLMQIPEAAGYKAAMAYVDKIISEWLKGEHDFPLIAYYGTGRGVFDTPQTRNSKKESPINEGYHGALDGKANFRRFFDHFYYLEDLERREKEEKKDWEYRLPKLEVIREAIHRMLPSFSNPHSKVHPLRFLVEWRHDDRLQTLRIDQLSDGYRTTLAMTLDIASRLAILNPSGRNALDADGIVLIDEIDLHLHPSWQQRILPDLMRTFPNIQFVVTTHSPQVISTVSADSIRIIQPEADRELKVFPFSAAKPSQQTKGVSSANILASVMGIDPVPKVDESQWLSEYRAFIQQGLQDSPDGKKLREKLIAHFGEQHPEILDCDKMIRFEAFKRKLPKPGNDGNSGYRS
jgi:predicted ATP-binding protein involved in virulence